MYCKHLDRTGDLSVLVRSLGGDRRGGRYTRRSQRVATPHDAISSLGPATEGRVDSLNGLALPQRWVVMGPGSNLGRRNTHPIRVFPSVSTPCGPPPVGWAQPLIIGQAHPDGEARSRSRTRSRRRPDALVAFLDHRRHAGLMIVSAGPSRRPERRRRNR